MSEQFLPPLPDDQDTEGLGPIAGRTPVFNFNLVNFDWSAWQDYEWHNWVNVDALLNVAIGFLNLRGIWRPNTDYVLGETVFDPTDPTLLLKTDTTHTSGTSWATDEPLYWEAVTEAAPPVITVHGRIGEVVAVAADYSAFYYLKAETYTQAQVNAIDAAIRAAFAAADTSIRTDFAAADATLQTNINAVNTSIRTDFATADTSIRNDFAAADTSIRTDFAAADAAITAARIAGDNALQAQIDGNDTDIATLTTGLATTNTNLGTTNTNVTAANTNASSRLKWRGQWAPGTYQINDVVQDGDFLFVATAVTTEEPNDGSTNPPTPTDWDLLVSGGGSAVHIGDTAPALPVPGQLWFATADPVGLYVYLDDGNTQQWVQANGGIWNADNTDQIDDIAGTTYTAVATDRGKMKRTTDAAAVTVTIDANVHAENDAIAFLQAGAGLMTLVAGAGMTLNSRGGALASAGQYAVVGVKFLSATEAYVYGDIA